MAAFWYVLHTYSGQEARAKQALLEKARAFSREDAIEEIFIPEEDVVEVVKGQRRTSKRKLLPGYLLVKMELDDEVWHIVKNTSKITGFAHTGVQPTPKISFEEGEDVRVIQGPFSNFSGRVGEVRPEREQVQVMVAVFGRATPVWLSYEHVEKA